MFWCSRHPPACVTKLAAALTLASAAHLARAAPPPEHVVIVIEENHSFSAVIGSPEAPFLNRLAADGASLTNMYALTHPSQPNYMQLFSGANQGVTNNDVPAAGAPFQTPNLAAALRSVGRRFIGYCEDLPEVGSTVSYWYAYVRRHNPWVNWQSDEPGVNQLPADVNQPFSAFPTNFDDLPDVSIVVPNLLNDMHDGSIAQGDAWLEANLGAYAEWALTHNSLLIITFDEDESLERNRIPTIFYGAGVRRGQIDTVWTLHNLLRTIEDLYDAPHSGAAARCAPIVGIWQDDKPVQTRRFRAGAGGFDHAPDTYLEQAAPDLPHGNDPALVVDGSPMRQGLIAFPDIIGPGERQIRPGEKVHSAKLLLLTGAGPDDPSYSHVAAHRLLVPWDEGATWNSLVGGVSLDDEEAAFDEDFALMPNVDDAWAIFDVTATVQIWSNAPRANHGWLLQPRGGDGWRPVSSNGAALADRALLEVTYEPTPPPQPGDMNCDGAVNNADIDLFVLALIDPDAYGEQQPDCDVLSADVNLDGAIDNADIEAFVECLLAGGC